jgi:hypothetical protein
MEGMLNPTLPGWILYKEYALDTTANRHPKADFSLHAQQSGGWLRPPSSPPDGGANLGDNTVRMLVSILRSHFATPEAHKLASTNRTRTITKRSPSFEDNAPN